MALCSQAEPVVPLSTAASVKLKPAASRSRSLWMREICHRSLPQPKPNLTLPKLAVSGHCLKWGPGATNKSFVAYLSILAWMMTMSEIAITITTIPMELLL